MGTCEDALRLKDMLHGYNIALIVVNVGVWCDKRCCNTQRMSNKTIIWPYGNYGTKSITNLVEAIDNGLWTKVTIISDPGDGILYRMS